MERSHAREAAGSTPAAAAPSAVPPDLAEAVARYGDGLGDYCRMWLGDVPDAAVAETVRAALLLARDRDPAPGGAAHGGRYGRARLYALARVCCLNGLTRPARGAAAIAGAPPRGRAADAAEPALAGLQALDRRQREVLELAFRHGLEAAEIAAVTGLGEERVEALLTEAQDTYEAWVNTVLLARASRAACPEGAGLAAAWEARPGRSARTRLRVHVTGCATCSAPARLTVDAGALLRRIPVTPLTGAQRALVLDPAASPPTGVRWRADGFPVQPDPERPATPADPLHAPTLSAALAANRTTGFWDEDSEAPADDLDVTKPIRILRQAPAGAGPSAGGGRPAVPPAFGSGGPAAPPDGWRGDDPVPRYGDGLAGGDGGAGDTVEVARPPGSGVARRRNPWARLADALSGDGGAGEPEEASSPRADAGLPRGASGTAGRRTPWSRFGEGPAGGDGGAGDTVEVARPPGPGVARRRNPWARLADGPSGGGDTGEPGESSASDAGSDERRGPSGASRRESLSSGSDDGPSGGYGGETVEVPRSPLSAPGEGRGASGAAGRRGPWSGIDDGPTDDGDDPGDTGERARPSPPVSGELRRRNPSSWGGDGLSGGDDAGKAGDPSLARAGSGGRRGASGAPRRESPWSRFYDDQPGLGGPLRLGGRATPVGDVGVTDDPGSRVGTFQQRSGPDDRFGSGLGAPFDAGDPDRSTRRRRPGKALVIGGGLVVTGGLLWAVFGMPGRTGVLGVANETPVGAAPPATPAPSASARASGDPAATGGGSGRTPDAAATSGGVPGDGGASRGGGTPKPTATAGARSGGGASGSGGAGRGATPGATRSPGGESGRDTDARARPGGTATPAPPKGGVPGTGSTTAPVARPSHSPKPTPTARRTAPARTPSPAPTRSAASPARLVVTVGERGRGSRTLLLRAVNGTVAWQAGLSTPLLQLSARQGITPNGLRSRLQVRLTPLDTIAARGSGAVDELLRTCGRAQTATLRITWRGVNAAGVRKEGVTPLRIRFTRPCP